jgi:hypothetical protein
MQRCEVELWQRGLLVNARFGHAFPNPRIETGSFAELYVEFFSAWCSSRSNEILALMRNLDSSIVLNLGFKFVYVD